MFFLGLVLPTKPVPISPKSFRTKIPCPPKHIGPCKYYQRLSRSGQPECVREHESNSGRPWRPIPSGYHGARDMLKLTTNSGIQPQIYNKNLHITSSNFPLQIKKPIPTPGTFIPDLTALYSASESKNPGVNPPKAQVWLNCIQFVLLI